MKNLLIQTATVLFILNCLFGLWSMESPEDGIQLWTLRNSMSGAFSFWIVVTLCTLAYMLLQAVLAAVYHPVKKKNEAIETPSVTVLIPAYNEGKQVLETIRSVIDSDYPADKMEILAIDDGSKDDTWQWIRKGAELFPGRIRGLQQPKNGGKKRALCRGIAESTGSIIVTVDSDSILEKTALRNLLIPFSRNEKIGGVAGNIRVRNANSCLMAKMLDVAFVFGCDFLRTAQSAIGYVLCTPGAISAYRRSAVQPLLQAWLNQTFLGQPSTIGEDRALTSLLLQNNWNVVCQNNAVAWTEVPHSYPKLCKMLLRWTRGDVRESILLLKFVCSKWQISDWRWTFFQLNVFSQIIGILLPLVYFPCTFVMMYLFRDHLFFMLYYTVALNGIWSFLPALVYVKRTNLSGIVWAFAYGIFSAIALSWICVYSLFTLQNSKWLTREVKKTC